MRFLVLASLTALAAACSTATDPGGTPAAVAPDVDAASPATPSRDGGAAEADGGHGPSVTCASARHACGSTCASNTSVASCGASCTPCPVPAGATAATCDGKSCGLVCSPGLEPLYGRCLKRGWQTLASVPTARQGLAAVRGPDGRIYAIGGNSVEAGTVVEAYAPSTDTWASVAPLPFTTFYPAAAVSTDGRIYVLTRDHTQIYDVATGAWSQGAAVPTHRQIFAAVSTPDGRIYAIGGVTDANSTTGATEVYAPKTDTWSAVAPMPTARVGLAAARGADGRIYALGGDPQSQFGTEDVAEAYDPVKNQWVTVDAMPTPRHCLGTALGPDGNVYAFGGTSGMAIVATVEAYASSVNRWTPAASLRSIRNCPGVATDSDGRMLVVGGGGNFDAHGVAVVSTVEAFVP